MPRKVTSKIHDYFIYNEFASVCQLNNKEGYVCNTAIKGKHAGNLEKHVKTWHADEWQNYWADKTTSFSQSSAVSSNTIEDSPSHQPHFVNVDFSNFESEVFQYQSTLDTRKRKVTSTPTHNVKVAKPSIKFTDIEESVIELVTLNGIPPSIVEASGFKKLLSIVPQQSVNAADDIALSQSRLQKLIKNRADSIRAIIAETVKNKLISLRIDCAIAENRHIFSINVHIRKKNKFHIFHLAILHLPIDHRPDVLKNKIMNILREYEIHIGQIYYVLVTNCSFGIKKPAKTENVENTIKILSEKDELERPEYDDYDSDFDIFEVEETELDFEDDENHEIACDEEVTNDEATEKLIDDVIACWSQEPNLIVSRSLTHSLQLAVQNSLDEDEEIRVLLRKIRNILKKLRSQTYANQLKNLRCKKKPILDSKSRLGSTYDMLQRFMELKPYLDQLSITSNEINISLKECNIVMDIADSLKPLNNCARILAKDTTLSEFYKIWISCFLRTKKINTAFSLNLCKNMNKGKNWLFENIAFKSSLFLDPRFKNTLNADDYEQVFAHLSQLNQRVLDLKSIDANKNPEDLKHSIKIELNGVDEDDDLNTYIQSIVKTPTTLQNNNSPDITTALENFKDSEPLIELRNVPAFWQEKKHLNSEVYKLSQIILSVPATNAYLETFTSQMKFISSNFEPRLYKDILMIRSNFHFFRDYHNSSSKNMIVFSLKNLSNS